MVAGADLRLRYLLQWRAYRLYPTAWAALAKCLLLGLACAFTITDRHKAARIKQRYKIPRSHTEALTLTLPASICDGAGL